MARGLWYRQWTRPSGVRVDGPGGPKVLKVLKFDRPCGPEGCGIALRVHSEHDWQEQSDAPIIVSRFPFRGDEFYNSAPRNGKPYNRASPAGRFPGFIIMAPFIFKGIHHRCRQAAYILAAEPPPQPSAAKPLSNLRTLGAKAPSILRTFSLPSEPARKAKPMTA